MHPRQNPSPSLIELSRLQAGVVNAEQLAGLGLGRHPLARLLASDQWQRLDRGLYRVGEGEPDWLGWAWGGVLLGGPDARLAGTAAAHLHRFGPEPREIEVLVPHSRVLRSRAPWVFRRERSGVREGRSPGSPPRTTVEDTVLDLVSCSTTDEALGWVTAALQNRRTTVPRLRRALLGRSKMRHRQLLEEVLTDVSQGAETPLEIAYLRDVERAHGLPRGVRQQRSTSAHHVRDVVYEEYATVVELDGRLGHEGMGRFRDMARDNAAAVNGEQTLRYGWFDVNGRACLTAHQLGMVLNHRGWRGVAERCRHCRSLPPQVLGEWMP
ncbi:type IV toxin-antitoxin system AbiEi family antitoxin domain-containing protein [uncultured Friedmanniella sp.]|uniref:type IV toxin-antitoxin system AbiEi family antitoxin domain-containing protein n=1 Tax=uncultured Friedmanniella sp. TaxID=335381 RepID=UPI0035C98C18